MSETVSGVLSVRSRRSSLSEFQHGSRDAAVSGADISSILCARQQYITVVDATKNEGMDQRRR